MKIAKYLTLFFLTLLVILLIWQSFNVSEPLIAETLVDSTVIPTKINNCLKDIKASRKLISHYHKKNDFYLIRYFGESAWPVFPDQFEKAHFYRIIITDELGCLTVLDGIPSRTNSWKKFVPEDVANIFALDDLKILVLEAGGVEKFISKNFINVIQDGDIEPWMFFPETAWAFKQMGIKLPQPYKIVEYYNYD